MWKFGGNLLYLSALLGHTPDIKLASFSSLNKSTLYKPEAELLISDIHHHIAEPTDLSLKMENKKNSGVGKISVMCILHVGKLSVILSEALSCLNGRHRPFISHARGPYYFP